MLDCQSARLHARTAQSCEVTFLGKRQGKSEYSLILLKGPIVNMTRKDVSRLVVLPYSRDRDAACIP